MHPEDHLKRGGNQYEKYIACNLCFERWLRIDVQEPQSSTEAPEPPAASAASSMRPREQLSPALRNWRACILGLQQLLTLKLLCHRVNRCMRVLNEWSNRRAALRGYADPAPSEPEANLMVETGWP